MLECLKPFGDAAVKWGRGPLPRCPLGGFRGVAGPGSVCVVEPGAFSSLPPGCPGAGFRTVAGNDTYGRPPPAAARRPSRGLSGPPRPRPLWGGQELSLCRQGFGSGRPRVIGSRLGVSGRSPSGYRVSFGSMGSVPLGLWGLVWE